MEAWWDHLPVNLTDLMWVNYCLMGNVSGENRTSCSLLWPSADPWSRPLPDSAWLESAWIVLLRPRTNSVVDESQVMKLMAWSTYNFRVAGHRDQQLHREKMGCGCGRGLGSNEAMPSPVWHPASILVGSPHVVRPFYKNTSKKQNKPENWRGE